jgi:ankyrin repeat protein
MKAHIIVSNLLKANPDSILYEDKSKSIPLHIAIKAGSFQTAQVLLTQKKEEQLNHVDANGNTALHLAAQTGYAMLRLILAEMGKTVDINRQNAQGRTILHEVVCRNDEQSMKLLFHLKANPEIMDKV